MHILLEGKKCVLLHIILDAHQNKFEDTFCSENLVLKSLRNSQHSIKQEHLFIMRCVVCGDMRKLFSSLA